MRLKTVSLLAGLAITSLAFTSGIGPATAAVQPGAHAVRQVTPSWVNSATVYEVNVRQFSPEGSFNAVTAALPRIKQLGTDVIWLMPIFPVGKLNAKGSLGSPYAVANYQAVNPDYGTDADFKQLVDTAHSMGMKVVLDWVANHSAWDNPWVTAHPDWYSQDGNGNIIWPAGTDWTDVADFNYGNPAMRQAMIDSMKYWVSNFDIDGYRCDAAGMVPTDFWNSATSQVNQLKQLWWLAEDQNTSDLLLQAFSANYNWSLLDALNHVGNRDSIAYAVSGSVANYPSGTYPMNFITNHDENSWNGTEFQRLGNAVRESAAITFLTPGIPLIYNGQEIGMNHQLAFFEKDAIDWGSNPGASSWSAFYAKLISLRKNNPALWSGAAGGKLSFIDTAATSVLSFARATKTNRVLLFANLSASAKRIHFRVAKSQAGSYFKYSDGKRIKLAVGKTAQVRIPAWSFVIYSSASAK